MSIELKDDLPAMSPETAKQAMQRYQEICKAMLEPSDFQKIGEKDFKKKSAWRKLARAFDISDEIVKEQREELEKGGFLYRIHVKAMSRGGRSAIGVGVCSTRERAFAHMDHDVYAIAHTRAKNRAISDLIGSGEVSAEEIEAPKEKVTYWEGGNKELLKK
jgi:hypothetical protein